MKGLLNVARLIDSVSEWMGRLVAWLTLAMVLVGAWNALARYSGRGIGLDLSSNGLLEAQWYMFSVVFLLGASYSLKHDAHVRVDVIYGRLGLRAQAWINLLGALLLLLPFCAFGIAFTWSAVAESWQVAEQSPDPGGLPRYPIKALVPLAFVLLFLQGLSQAIAQLGRLTGACPSVECDDEARSELHEGGR